jgi:methyl-accepting chemotaxis protein
MLRRTAGVDTREARPALDDAELWAARDRAARAATDAERLAERVAASATRQRTHVEAATERASLLRSRGEALGTSLRRVTDVLDRLGVVALNAGLEGARSNEPAARGLLLMSEEIRGHVGRGTEATRELMEAVEEVSHHAAELGQRLDRTQRDVAEIGTDAAQLKSSAQEANAALADLEIRLRKATGFDPETAKLLRAAEEHARALVTALSALDGIEAAEPTRALAPILRPLAKLLAGMPSSDETPSSSEG